MVPYAIAMVVLVGALLACERREYRPGIWLLKPAAALTFVAAAVAHGALSSTYGRLLLAGLCFCLGGDVLLIPRGRRAFLGGLVSFLLGHLAYSAAFVARGVEALWAAGALAGMLVLAVLVGRWLLPHVEPPMKVPVLAYMTVITAMVVLAASASSSAGAPLIFAGAFTFYLSDLCVARERFVAKGFVNRAVGLPLYFGAQLLLASTARHA